MTSLWVAPSFNPVAVAIGPLAIRWYALAYIAGLLGGWFYARYLAKRPSLWGAQKPPSMLDIDDLIVYVALGVVLGGRLGQVLFYDLSYYAQRPVEILMIWRGGMSFHGGLLGSLIAVAFYSRSRKLSAFSMFDLCCTVVPLGLFLGRIANFINGELWGRPAIGIANFPNFPYAMVFPSADDGIPRYPSQLYEAFAEGFLLFLLMALSVRLFGFRRPGMLSGIFLIGYAIARSICELFREPDVGFLFESDWAVLGGGLTMGMLLSIPMLLCGVGIVAWARTARPQGIPTGTGKGAA